MRHPLAHENLDAYRLARDVARWVRATDFARGDADLKDQALRASRSCVLNLAEGCSSLGGNRRKHFRIALRKSTVEPVFGQVKEVRGFRRFSLRGIAAATAEWELVCLTHNLLKLFRYGGRRLAAA